MSKFQRDYDRERFQGVKDLTASSWRFAGPTLKVLFWVWIILLALSQIW